VVVVEQGHQVCSPSNLRGGGDGCGSSGGGGDGGGAWQRIGGAWDRVHEWNRGEPAEEGMTGGVNE
jgi:hypothetical protein